MYARSTPIPKPRKSEFRKFDAPVGGWISNRSLSAPNEAGSPPGAAVLDNYFPRAGSVKLRRGKQLYATLENTDIDVTALFSYANGNNKHLFAANADSVYDITTVMFAEAGQISDSRDQGIGTQNGDAFGWGSTIGLDVISNFSGGDWATVQFATTGGVYLVGVNAKDDGFIFDGTDFWANLPGGVSRLAYTDRTALFTDGATLMGTSSSATATIYKAKDGYLYLYNIVGTFVSNEPITDSSGGAATADGTPFVASPGVKFGNTGLTTADMAFVWAYKSRLWFIQKDSLTAWYMKDADAIGGNAVSFPLAGVFTDGGSLVFGQKWSTEAGDQGGLSAQNIFVTTQGEVAVYQGSDPSEASSWSEVGVYRVGTPMGKHAFFRGGGDLAIATSVGLVPLSKAISLDITSLNIGTVSYKIADAWSDAVQSRGLVNWQCKLWPEQKMALISPPDLSGATQPVIFVSNTETGAWCRYTGWQALCMEVFDGRLYFGSPNGQIFMANVSGTDNGDTYTGTIIPLFDDMGMPGSNKIGKTARVVSRANVQLDPQVIYKTDFDMTIPAPPNAVAIGASNLWGTGLWGQSVWGALTPEVINQDGQSVGGMGYAVSLSYQVTSGAIGPIDDEVIRMEITYTPTEVFG
jgi:hypothetical protein